MKKVLVTGANTGIGMGLCLELLKRGFFVVACCRKPQYFSLLHARFNSVSENFSCYAFDLETNFCDHLEELITREKQIDVLINNAGYYPQECGDFLADLRELDKGMQINFKAPMQICQRLVPVMKNLPWGRIINVSSKMGSISDNQSGGSLGYRTSKAAFNMFTVNLARELHDSKIRVFCVHPGWIQTRMGGQEAPDKVYQAVERILFCLEQEAEQFHGGFLFGQEQVPW